MLANKYSNFANMGHKKSLKIRSYPSYVLALQVLERNIQFTKLQVLLQCNQYVR